MTTAYRARSTIGSALGTAAAFALALAAGSASAALYKWTDSSGRIVYSDQPPPAGVKYDTVGGAPPPDNPNAARDLANKEAQFKKEQRERAEADAKAGQARTDAAKRAEVCEQARAGIRTYQADNVPVVTINAKGEQVVVDAAERQRRLAEQQRLAREYCGR
ncbi:MAG TPA: DUF4124 domain-containing protein [Casimicrobiaceae bacterium]|nr:DUF4124 domain-containing protein [Casimicrobiaceae bacterium]